MIRDALATYRITRLITTDTLLAEPRERLLDWLEERRLFKVAEGLECSFCVSVWIAFAIVIGRRSRLWPPVRDVLALAAVAGLLSAWEPKA